MSKPRELKAMPDQTSVAMTYAAGAITTDFSVRTALGWTAVRWSREQLFQLTIGHPTRGTSVEALVQAASAPKPVSFDRDPALRPWQRRLVARLRQYADGDDADFQDVPLAWHGTTPFARRVLELCRRIPYGQTASYRQLASAAGSPRAARAVGNVMAANRFPLVIPCHRVVGADLQLRGFSAPTGVALKQRLLQLEGSSRGPASRRLRPSRST